MLGKSVLTHVNMSYLFCIINEDFRDQSSTKGMKASARTPRDILCHNPVTMTDAKYHLLNLYLRVHYPNCSLNSKTSCFCGLNIPTNLIESVFLSIMWVTGWRCIVYVSWSCLLLFSMRCAENSSKSIPSLLNILFIFGRCFKLSSFLSNTRNQSPGPKFTMSGAYQF